MQDRIPTYPGRVMLTPVPDAENTYDMTLADIPITTGTALNKKNLLQDSTAALVGLDEDATPNDVLAVLARQLADLQSSTSGSNSSLSAQIRSIQNTVTTLQTKMNGMIKYGTSDLTPGVSSLDTGAVYLVYK